MSDVKEAILRHSNEKETVSDVKEAILRHSNEKETLSGAKLDEKDFFCPK
ncbi:hypothetical protein HXZ66_05340 [Bacillus sp. A116_S68]|nr:hypothetical protein HXZ66_05340 [Bacillus sp. A116_S68]